MAGKIQEIRAKFMGETHRWGETVVVELQVEEKGFGRGKGVAEEGELEEGLWYRFFGRWVQHFRWGSQFQWDTFVPCRALDEAGLVRYLCRAPHVGKATARKLVKCYGSEAVRKLRTEPAVAAQEIEARGFNEDAAREAAEFLSADAATEDAIVELVGLFAGRSLPRALPKKCVRKWGNTAVDAIRANPYVLLTFKGVGFAKADELYLSLGHDPKAIARQALCAWYRCASDTDGDTWLSGGEIYSTLLQKIGATRANPRDAAAHAIALDLLELHRDQEGSPWFASTDRSWAELQIAQSAAGMLHYGGPEWPGVEDLDVSDHQREQLAAALGGRLSILCGSPGTGKTYTAARLIAAVRAAHGPDSIAVVAPTGKAAVRISEALEEYGLGIRAKTVHSYLEVARANGENDSDFSFQRGPGNPVEEQFVVCDEASMLDARITASLLGALRMDGHLLLVGDVNQLPPVGHGAPLRDLIAAGLPLGELTEIRRNAGAIVRTCAAMRDERPWSIPGSLDLASGENLMIRRHDGFEAKEEILRVLRMVRERGNHDPVWDVQVLVAVNKKSPLSREELNTALQAELNGRSRPKQDARFWRGDKVVCLQNSFFPAVDDLMEEEVEEDVVVEEGADGRAQVYVANGELGRVVEDEPRRVLVEFPSPKRFVVVPKGGDGTDRLDLGYALSVHKSQGSEWPIVIVALDGYGGARLVCDRSWLYTAISRAKKACLLVGLEKTAKEMCRRVKIRSRKTFLVEKLAAAREELARLAEEKASGGTGDWSEEEDAVEVSSGAAEGVRDSA